MLQNPPVILILASKQTHMKRVLVVGSTGQLGYRIVEKLLISGMYKVRALKRVDSDISSLQKLEGLELVTGALEDPGSLQSALQDVDVVISTANPAVPRSSSDSFENSVTGHGHLIRLAEEAGVQRFIFTSVVSMGPREHKVPLLNSKRRIEAMITGSGLDYTIFRAAAFMDIHFAFMGSDLPLRGSTVSSIRRPWKFMNSFFEGIRRQIPDKGVISITGNGMHPSSYICIEDVAEFHVRAIQHPAASFRTLDIGGPEALTELDIKKIYEEIYQKPLRVKSSPPLVLKVVASLMGMFNPNAANILILQYMSGQCNTSVAGALTVAGEFGIQLTSARNFLLNKAKLDA